MQDSIALTTQGVAGRHTNGVAEPKYQRVKEAVRQGIADGTWPPGTALPSESDLCRIFGVSRITVRRAIELLAQDGKLVTRHGKGTFVAKPKLEERFLQQSFGFFEDMERRGLQPKNIVVQQEVIPAPVPAAERLGVPPGTPVHVLVRVHCAQEEKIYVSTSYLLASLCPGLAEEDLSYRSLYRLLRTQYGLTIARARRSLEAVAAGPWEARLLDLVLGSPLLRIDHVGYRADGTAFEYAWALHCGDRARLEVEVLLPAADE